MLSVEQTFPTESSFHSRFSVVPTPFLEPNPLMMAFSRFPPFNRRPSYPQSPGRVSLPIGALLCATPAPEFGSVIPSLLPCPYLVLPPPPPPPAAGGGTQKQTCNDYVGRFPVYSPSLCLQLPSLHHVEFSSKMFNSGVNFEDISVIFYLLFKKRERKEKKCQSVKYCASFHKKSSHMGWECLLTSREHYL